MPKESKTFNGFGGGLNIDRDLSDLRMDGQGKDELSVCNQAQVDDLGKIHFQKFIAPTSNSARQAGYDPTGNRLLIHDGKHYLQDGIYKLGHDINWANNTDYRPETPTAGKFNPATPVNQSNGVDIKFSIDDSEHIVIFSGVGSSFNDGSTGIICGRTSASADDIKWSMANHDQWAIAWNGAHWNDAPTGAANSNDGNQRKPKPFEALWSGDMVDADKAHDSSTNGGAGDGGYWASLNKFGPGTQGGERYGMGLTGSVEAGDAAVALTDLDTVAIWQRSDADDGVGIIFRPGDTELNNGNYPPGGYGKALTNIEAHDLYVELQVKDIQDFDLGVGFGVTSRRDVTGMNLDPSSTSSYNDVRAWWLSAQTVSKAGAIWAPGGNNFRVFKLPYETATKTSTTFNPSNVSRMGATLSLIDSSTYAADGTNTAIPRLEIRDIRFIPQGDNFNWADNNYTFFQTTVKNGIESLPFRYRDIPQGGSSLNETPYSFLYGVNAKHNMTLYKPANSGDAGRIYYQELDENNSIKGDKFLLAEYDYDLGVRWADSDDWENWVTSSMTHTFENPPVTSTYTFESGYPEGTTSCNALFKTSAVIGRQVYIGNCAKQRGYRNFNLAYGGLNEYASHDNFELQAGSYTHPYAIVSLNGSGSTINIRRSTWISLRDYAGTAKFYYCISGSSSGTAFQEDATAQGQLESLKERIESSSGHNGTIRCSQVYQKGGAGSTYYMVLTQDTAGTQGNTAIKYYMGDEVDLITDFIGGDNPIVAGDQVWLEGTTSNNSATLNKYFQTDATISADLATNAEGTGRETISDDINLGAFTSKGQGQMIGNARNYDLDENSCNWVVYAPSGAAPTFNTATASKPYIDFIYGASGEWQGFQLSNSHIHTIIPGQRYRITVNISQMPAGMDCDWRVYFGGVYSEILHTTDSDNATGHDMDLEVTATADTDMRIEMKNGDVASEVRFDFIGVKHLSSGRGEIMNITTASGVTSSGGRKNSGNFIVRGFQPFDGSLIMKSAIGRPAGFSDLSYIDMEFGGDSINVMEAAGDRLFVFTTNKLVIINVAQDIEFTEGEFEGYGIDENHQVCKVGEGLAWVNRYGVFFYDGREVTSLTAEKYSSIDWGATPSIAFFPDRARLIVWETGGGPAHVYSFETNSWVGVQVSPMTNYQPLSRAVNDGQSTYYRGDTSGNIKILDYTNTYNLITSVDIKTGNIHFDDITREKKFYKLQVRGKELDNLRFWGSLDGGTNWFLIGTASSTVGTSVGEDNFNMPAELRKGKHIRIRIQNSGNVQSRAEISDMSIVYRNRRIK
tara:strand:- start:2322 stop:6227 length:3906 start_codon:yes stop_codon:yes gene_type:complete